MVPASVGSNASARPRVTAVTRLIQRIWTAVIGRAMPARSATIRVMASPRIGRQRPADDLLEVVVDGAPLAHGRGDRGEIVVRQHELRRFLGGLAALPAHGDANVGALERGASFTPSPVIATVSPRDCSAVTRRSLCGGRGAREDVASSPPPRRVRRRSWRRVSAPVTTRSVLRQPDLTGDGARRRGVIAGDHLHADAGGNGIRRRRRSLPCAADRSGRRDRQRHPPSMSAVFKVPRP